MAVAAVTAVPVSMSALSLPISLPASVLVTDSVSEEVGGGGGVVAAEGRRCGGSSASGGRWWWVAADAVLVVAVAAAANCIRLGWGRGLA